MAINATEIKDLLESAMVQIEKVNTAFGDLDISTLEDLTLKDLLKKAQTSAKSLKELQENYTLLLYEYLAEAKKIFDWPPRNTKEDALEWDVYAYGYVIELCLAANNNQLLVWCVKRHMRYAKIQDIKSCVPKLIEEKEKIEREHSNKSPGAVQEIVNSYEYLINYIEKLQEPS